MQEQVLRLLALPAGSKILEAGCGHARVAINAVQHGMNVTAIDCLDYNVEQARRNAKKLQISDKQLKISKMDYEHLECVATGSLDGVYTLQALGHATDFSAALAGFFRTLRPGGRVALLEMERRRRHPGEVKGDCLSKRLKLVNEICVYPGNEATKEDFFKEQLEKAGFVDVQVSDYSANILPMWRLCFAILIIPFVLIRLFGADRVFPTVTAICNGYLGRGRWRFVGVSGKKPENTMP
jgi:sterol 24-C-methyltransferase